MSEKFKAIVLNQSDEKFSREIQNLDKGFFKTGDVFVKIDYSSLNYKDALILKNGGKLVKEYPHIPGIDFVGKVVESESKNFTPGAIDNVKVSPSGMNTDIHASRDYRANMVKVFAKKAVDAC